MARLKQKSAWSLKQKIQGKEVVCWGAGRRLENTCLDLQELGLEKMINYIVDNNEAIWNTKRTICGIDIPVRSPEYLRKNIHRNTVLVISMDKVKSVFEQIQGYPELDNTPCFQYPVIRYRWANMWNWLFRMLPLRRAILFQGEGDSCENAMALYEYMGEHGLLEKYKVIWLCASPAQFKENANVKYINRKAEIADKKIWNAWRYNYYRYTCRYLMYENKFIQKYREQQISIYLKHGTFMLKNVKGKIVLPPNINHAICTSENYAGLAAEQESIKKEKLLICGSPRLDFLYREKHVLETLGMYQKGKKYVIWLPTMRQASFAKGRIDSLHRYSYGIPLMQSEDDFRYLNEELKKLNYMLIIKPHPRQDLSVYRIKECDHILFISQAILDMHNFTVHSLMRETDALISDYSSIAFDYMLLERPIAYTIDDLEEYKIGFSVENPFHFMPGNKLEKIEDMIGFLQDIADGKDFYKEERHKIRDYIHQYQDCNNSERFLKLIGLI